MVIGLCYTNALYLEYKGAKNIHVFQVLIWVFGDGWWLLNGVRNLDLHFNIVNGLLYTYIPNFGSLS